MNTITKFSAITFIISAFVFSCSSKLNVARKNSQPEHSAVITLSNNPVANSTIVLHNVNTPKKDKIVNPNISDIRKTIQPVAATKTPSIQSGQRKTKRFFYKSDYKATIISSGPGTSEIEYTPVIETETDYTNALRITVIISGLVYAGILGVVLYKTRAI